MAKVNELKNSFSSSRKQVSKPTNNDIERITTAVEKKKVSMAESEDELIKTSIDFPAAMFKEMKIRLIGNRKSMRDYILALVEKDLNNK